MAPAARTPVAAGTFYPADASRLRAQIRSFVDPAPPKCEAKAVVVPHAGYHYSGEVAGAVYSRVDFPDTFVMLGPNHFGEGSLAGIIPEGVWTTPLGSVPIDTTLAQRILEGSRCLEADSASHRDEHALEVQLPLLQAFGVSFHFVPIALQPCSYRVCEEIGRAIGEAIRSCRAENKRVTIVASTDMTHCGPAYYQLPPSGMSAREFAERQDRKAIEAILSLDPERLFRTVERERVSMCGMHATTAMLVAATSLGATRAELVAYRTSADVTADRDTAVGYAGILIR